MTPDKAHRIYDLLGVDRDDYILHVKVDGPLASIMRLNADRIELNMGADPELVASDWSRYSYLVQSVDGKPTKFTPDPDGLIEFLEAIEKQPESLGPYAPRPVGKLAMGATAPLAGMMKSGASARAQIKNRVRTRIPPESEVAVFISPGIDGYSGYQTTQSGSEWIFDAATKILSPDVAVIVTEDKSVSVQSLIDGGNTALAEAGASPSIRILAGFSRGGNLVLRYIASAGSESFDKVLLLDPYIADGLVLPRTMSNVVMIYNPRNWSTEKFGDMRSKFKKIGSQVGQSIETAQRHLEIAKTGLKDFADSGSTVMTESSTLVPKWMQQVFEDNNGSWKVGDIYQYAKNRSFPGPLNVKALADNNLEERPWETTTDTSMEQFVRRALDSNLDYPIIAINYPDGVFIADGVHRLWKARELGYDTIEGYMIDSSALEDIPQSADSAKHPKEA